jgi:hypothetical protein
MGHKTTSDVITEQLLEEMHTPWRLAGGKLREDNSDN